MVNFVLIGGLVAIRGAEAMNHATAKKDQKKHHMPNSRKARIAQLNSLLEREPDAIEPRGERAGLLRELGMFEEAKRDYLELIKRKPDDFGVLNDFGTLALKAGYSSAARSLFEQAIRHHPDYPAGRVNPPTCCCWPANSRRRERISRRPCAPIPATSTRIAALAICWPRPATRRARGATAISALRTTLWPHCPIAAIVRRCASCCSFPQQAEIPRPSHFSTTRYFKPSSW
jgi:tetratricopeptide (TPR) repeat protein